MSKIGTALPEGWRIVIEVDQDYDPAAAVEWEPDAVAAYVEQFRTGELTAYGVILERPCSGPCGMWIQEGSLWGVDVEASNADNVYATLDVIPDPYLREVAQDLLDEYAS